MNMLKIFIHTQCVAYLYISTFSLSILPSVSSYVDLCKSFHDLVTFFSFLFGFAEIVFYRFFNFFPFIYYYIFCMEEIVFEGDDDNIRIELTGCTCFNAGSICWKYNCTSVWSQILLSFFYFFIFGYLSIYWQGTNTSEANEIIVILFVKDMDYFHFV